MNRIRLLPPQVACQIAAGEVFERPASVVKELVENSLDAGASQIEISLEAGGIGLIRVRDDGCGISREDLPLAVMRHATSKITCLEDLRQVQSFGFRGEALPSIAAVARLELISRTCHEPCGWRLKAGPAGISEPIPAAHPFGTTAIVADLFYSMPARRKFLRREEVEFDQVRSLIERLALGCFAVGFSLRHNQRAVWHLPPARTRKERQARLAQILGQTWLAQALEVECAAYGMRLSGWVSLPERALSQAERLFWYVNGRPVRAKLLSDALRLAYRARLPRGQQPQGVLYLELDPAWVDVNAHPAKLEVRFRDPGRVSEFITASLAQVLSRTSLSVGERFPLRVSEPHEGYGELAKDEAAAQPPLGEALAQVGKYILALAKDGVVIVDTQIACERILGEKFKSQLKEGKGGQPLDPPLQVSLSPSQLDLLACHCQALAALGIEAEAFGLATAVIRALPVWLVGVDAACLLRGLLAELDHLGGLTEAACERLAALVCRQRQEARLPLEEMNALLRQLEQVERAGPGSSSRPAWVRLDLQSLAGLFAHPR